MLDGDAARTLVEASQEADILVMGSRGHGPLQAALLGGVSHYVVRHAACPVVIHPRSAVGQGTSEPSAGQTFRACTQRLSRMRWRLTPISFGPADAEHGVMVQFAIRCLPRIPVATADLEHWLEQELNDLRSVAPQGTIRLSRLTQELPTTEVGIGWLIELELPEDEPLLGWDRLGFGASRPAAARAPADAAGSPWRSWMARAANSFGAMIIDVEAHPPGSHPTADPGAKSPVPDQPAAPAGGATTDEMSECSFPASDPPSVWTWEIETRSGTSGLPQPQLASSQAAARRRRPIAYPA